MIMVLFFWCIYFFFLISSLTYLIGLFDYSYGITVTEEQFYGYGKVTVLSLSRALSLYLSLALSLYLSLSLSLSLPHLSSLHCKPKYFHAVLTDAISMVHATHALPL